MITAGMDTTAISVEWAIAELVRNPDVQAKAQQELDQVKPTAVASQMMNDMVNLTLISLIFSYQYGSFY